MSRKREVLRTFAISLGVLAVFGTIAYVVWSYVFSGLDYRPLITSGVSPAVSDPAVSVGPTREAPHMEDVLNILLIGTDTRDPVGEAGQADVLIVLTVDRKHGSLKMMSIMRDLWVPIPGHANGKINSAFSIGGPALAIQTVNESFGLDIGKYAVVDFLGAENIIDAAGGVWIDVKEAEIPWVNKNLREENDVIFKDTPAVADLTQSGLQLLNGRQAVCYARVRKLDSDFKRTQRERDVVKALMESFSKVDLVRKTQIVQKGLSCVTTNLTPSEITWLSLEVLPLLGSGIAEMRLPTDGDYTVYTNGVWCMIADPNRLIPKVQEFIWEQTFPFEAYPTIPPPHPTSEPTPTVTPSVAPTATPEATSTPTPDVTPETTPEPTVTPGGTPEATPDASPAPTATPAG
jgi:LCP family protein required for cell wall assembly